MSGTLASRYQGRFGYRPALRVLPYPSPMEPPGDMRLPPSEQQPPAPQPAQQPAPQPAPVYAGAMPQDGANNDPGFDRYGQWGENRNNTTFGLPGWSTGLGVLGTLAGLATGTPGLGLLGTAIGTALEARDIDARFAGLSVPDRVDYDRGLLGNLTFGLLGRTPEAQWNDFFDQVQPTQGAAPPGAITSLNDFSFGPAPDTRNLTTPEPPAPTMTFSFDNVSYSQGAQSAQPGGMPGPTSDYDDSYGYMRGGYTGAGDDGIVQPWKPAGVVHEGELVIPAHIVSRLARLAQIN
jgi:hypothetical protein